AEGTDERAAVPHVVAPPSEQPGATDDDQVTAVGSPLGRFLGDHASGPGWMTSTMRKRRVAPRRLGQSIALPRLSPISAAPTGVSTDRRPASMSASRG